jgi:M26 IgA1-specific Metallo-endopeptidase N-terminal region
VFRGMYRRWRDGVPAVAADGLHAGERRARLQLVGTNLVGTYALGKSFSASGFSGFGPGSTFAGTFDGIGGISPTNYTISDLSTTLFPVIGSGATVRNINLADVNITAGSPIFIGALAGENRGTVRNVNALSGSISGGSPPLVDEGLRMDVLLQVGPAARGCLSRPPARSSR